MVKVFKMRIYLAYVTLRSPALAQLNANFLVAEPYRKTVSNHGTSPLLLMCTSGVPYMGEYRMEHTNIV